MAECLSYLVYTEESISSRAAACCPLNSRTEEQGQNSASRFFPMNFCEKNLRNSVKIDALKEGDMVTK